MADVRLNAGLGRDIAEVAGEFTFDVAQDAAEIMRTLVPVATGALRASIRVERDGTATFVGSDLDYAAPVEFGTRHTPAQPFELPALYAAASRAK